MDRLDTDSGQDFTASRSLTALDRQRCFTVFCVPLVVGALMIIGITNMIDSTVVRSAGPLAHTIISLGFIGVIVLGTGGRFGFADNSPNGTRLPLPVVNLQSSTIDGRLRQAISVAGDAAFAASRVQGGIRETTPRGMFRIIQAGTT